MDRRQHSKVFRAWRVEHLRATTPPKPPAIRENAARQPAKGPDKSRLTYRSPKP